MGQKLSKKKKIGIISSVVSLVIAIAITLGLTFGLPPKQTETNESQTEDSTDSTNNIELESVCPSNKYQYNNVCQEFIEVYVSAGNQEVAPYYSFFKDSNGLEELLFLNKGNIYKFLRLNNSTSHPFTITMPINTNGFFLDKNGNENGITGNQFMILVLQETLTLNTIIYECTTHASMQFQLYVSPNLGCTDPSTLNYDPTALFQDPSITCIPKIEGCMQQEADNYNANANFEPINACVYEGCMDTDADNYDSNYNVNNQSVCIIGGCTNMDASNYLSKATYNDNSCIFNKCLMQDALNVFVPPVDSYTYNNQEKLCYYSSTEARFNAFLQHNAFAVNTTSLGTVTTSREENEITFPTSNTLNYIELSRLKFTGISFKNFGEILFTFTIKQILNTNINPVCIPLLQLANSTDSTLDFERLPIDPAYGDLLFSSNPLLHDFTSQNFRVNLLHLGSINKFIIIVILNQKYFQFALPELDNYNGQEIQVPLTFKLNIYDNITMQLYTTNSNTSVSLSQSSYSMSSYMQNGDKRGNQEFKFFYYGGGEGNINDNLDLSGFDSNSFAIVGGSSDLILSDVLITVDSSNIVLGCTNSEANNYNSSANTDDGSCQDVITGCTDPTAFNYNSSANTDDASCNYLLPTLPLTRPLTHPAYEDDDEITINLDDLTTSTYYNLTKFPATFSIPNMSSNVNYYYFASNYSFEFRVNNFDTYGNTETEAYIVVKYGTQAEYETSKELTKTNIEDLKASGDGNGCIITVNHPATQPSQWYTVPSNTRYLEVFIYNFSNISLIDLNIDRLGRNTT